MFPTDPRAYKQCMNPNDDACQVLVAVDNTATGCIPRIDEGVVVLHHPRQVITWKIDPASSGTIFAQNGIVVENDTLPVFEDVAHPPMPDTVFRKRRNSPQFGLFKYTVRVVRSGIACDPLDPVIVNR